MKSSCSRCLAYVRLFWIVLLMASGMAVSGTVFVASTAGQVAAAVVSSISVQGNQRVDDETVRSYLTIQPGQNFTTFDTDESLRQLFATGLFSDVRISQSGSTLIVEVEENPTINLVLFEGNDKVKDELLTAIVQSKSLGVFSRETLESDTERVREAVRRSGRASAQVTSRVDVLENNRVNVVFTINEGGRTKIADINFVGNNAFGDRRLLEVISHNESNFLSWLRRDDIFDPDRLRADEERLRRFYFNNGFADFRVISAVGDLNAAENEYTITITVEEGERYAFGNIVIDNALTNVVGDEVLQDTVQFRTGDTYSARKIERTLLSMTQAIAANGYAFAEVTPRGERNFENRTIDITFFIDDGPRTYIDRIEISGNTRTRGYVIRREFDVSEGDAYNKVLVNKAKQRLEALGFFESVRITTRPGSSPDRVVLVVTVKDKPTGEFEIGGGFSTSNGAIAQISISERNFLGRGQFLRVSGGLGEDVERYELSFTEPYFLGRRIAAGFDLSRETSDANNGVRYDNEVTTFRLRASAPITDYLSATVNYTAKYDDLSPESGVDPLLLDENPANDPVGVTPLSAATRDALNRSPYFTSSVGYGFVYNSLDSTRNPRDGFYATFNQNFAGVGGDAQYVSTTGRLTGYYLLSEDLDIVFKGSAGAGNIIPFGERLRVTDHFFRGGQHIRGFDDVRGYGPRDPGTNEALGGLNFWNVSAEVQFPAPILPRSYGLKGAFFADAGSLFGNDTNVANVDDSGAIRASVGASIIWDSPFGPLRADIATPLAKEDFDQTQFFRFGVSSRF